MVNEVNGERGEFDEYDVCSEWQKGQKVKRSNVTFRKKRWVDASFLIIVDACFLNILV